MNGDAAKGSIKKQQWRAYSRTSLLARVALSMIVLLAASCHSKSKLPAPGSPGYTDYVSAFYTGLAGLQVGDDVRANGSLSQATTLVPGEPAAWADWGILALRQRNFDDAATRLQHAQSLVPNDDRVDYLLGLLAATRGDSTSAIADYRQCISRNPGNLRALYRLAGEVERQGGPDSDAEVQKLLEQLLKTQPDNLAALVDWSRIAAKRGDAPALHSAIERLSRASTNWPLEAKQQLEQLQIAASSATPRAAATRSTFLRNVLMRQQEFRDSLSEIAAQPGEEAEPIVRFLRMQNPSSQPAPPDDGMTFNEETVQNATGAWKWVGGIALNGDDAPVIAEADGRHVHLATGVDLPFPGGPAAIAPGPEGILALDYNYDFKNDLLFPGAAGLRLMRQDATNHFTDVTPAMKLPSALVNAAYTGAWAVDIEADGDLDIVLGTAQGLPTVLQNNGDGTFSPIHPFAGVSGIRQFVWADLNGDGNPDASLIDRSGTLHIFMNQRSGRFVEEKLPADVQNGIAIAVADTAGDGFLRLHVLRANGSIVAMSWHEQPARWTSQIVADSLSPSCVGGASSCGRHRQQWSHRSAGDAGGCW